MMKDLQYLPASLLAQGIRDKVFSSREVLDAFVEQIKLRNPEINAVVTLDRDGALWRAIEADEALSRGEVWGPLHGLPVTVQEDVDVRELRTTRGDPALVNSVANEDAVLTVRLRKAGAIILGKTNASPVVRGASTTSPAFGRTANPWSPKHATGGGAGGGAAAVAAGMTALDFGADFGGSLRTPAALCGVYALKVTTGRLPLDGVAALDRSLDTGGQAFEPVTALGVQARFIQDLQLGLDVLGNVMEPYHAEKSFKERRIAWTDELGDLPVSAAVKAAIRQFVEMATHQGAQLERRAVSGADLEKAWEIGGILAGATDLASPSNMPRFFRRFFGARGPQEGPGAALLRGLGAAPETLRSREATERILFERRSIGAVFDRFLAEWDVWICPTFPSAAALDEGAPGVERGQNPAGLKLDVDGHPVSQAAAGLGFNMLPTLAGNPVVVIPLAQSKEGLPIGVQIVGRRGWEADLLVLADHLNEIGCGYLRPSAMT